MAINLYHKNNVYSQLHVMVQKYLKHITGF
jgi:hypothetical protein